MRKKYKELYLNEIESHNKVVEKFINDLFADSDIAKVLADKFKARVERISTNKNALVQLKEKSVDVGAVAKHYYSGLLNIGGTILGVKIHMYDPDNSSHSTGLKFISVDIKYYGE